MLVFRKSRDIHVIFLLYWLGYSTFFSGAGGLIVVTVFTTKYGKRPLYIIYGKKENITNNNNRIKNLEFRAHLCDFFVFFFFACNNFH